MRIIVGCIHAREEGLPLFGDNFNCFQLLRHICDMHLYDQVKAKKMWQDLEKENKINRTWQSMKERFRKVGTFFHHNILLCIKV
jgi:hypothetical protein